MTYYLKSPSQGFSQYSNYGGTLISGYYVQSTASTENSLKATSKDSNDAFVWYAAPTTGLTLLSSIVNNSPSNSAYSVRDTTLINGLASVYGEGPLTADNAFNVAMPSSSCAKIYLRDLDLLTGWEYLGDLCASGVMPKSIPYLSNLAFTFWSLEWGVDSKYNQETTQFETLVRNDNPYSYYVDIYDSGVI